MIRTKKPKKQQKPVKDPVMMITNANYLNMAIFFLTLNKEFGFGRKRLAEVLESYLALMDNISRKGMTVGEMLVWCKEETGIDVIPFLDDVMMNNYDGWKAKVKKYEEARG
jgi:hypothetical protein